MLRSTVEKVSAPSDKDISWLNHTPHAAAVYASWPSLPPAHATLTSRWLATPYLGWTFTSGSRQPPGAFLNPSYGSTQWRVQHHGSCSKRGKPASAARVARAHAKLLEPIFQRLLRLLLGILADGVGLAPPVSARPAVPREIAEIGRAYTLACRRCWWTFSEWLIGRE